MRILLFFGFFCFFAWKISAQNINVAHHSYVDEVRGMASVNGKNFYVERILSNIYTDSTNLVGLNESGKIIFKKNINLNDGNFVVNVHNTLNKRVLVYGLANGCNVDKENRKNFILKIDTNGVTQYSATSQYMANGSLAKFIDFAEHSDSSYYFLSDSLLFHFTKNLQFISAIAHGLVYAKAMTLNNSGNLMIHGKTGNLVSKNMEITTGGTLVNIQNSGLDLKFVRQSPQGNYFGLAMNGTIEKLSSALLPSGNSSLSIAPTDIRAFTLRHDSLFFADVSPSSNPMYGVMDQNLSALYVAPSLYRNIYPRAITINKQNKINILATATSSVGPNNTFVSFFQFPKNGSFTAIPDIGVFSFTITNSIYTANNIYCQLNLDVTVRNYGSDTVKGFYLNALGKQLTCGYEIFHKRYTNHIPPNGSVNVTTGTFLYPVATPVNQQPGFSFSHNVCVYTTVPDSKNDININNDHLCRNMSLVVGIDENELRSGSVNVSPNPFKHEFTVRSEQQINAVRIYDAIGKLVEEFACKAKEFTVPGVELSSGIYLLKIETEKGVLIKKIVKQ